MEYGSRAGSLKDYLSCLMHKPSQLEKVFGVHHSHSINTINKVHDLQAGVDRVFERSSSNKGCGDGTYIISKLFSRFPDRNYTMIVYPKTLVLLIKDPRRNPPQEPHPNF